MRKIKATLVVDKKPRVSEEFVDYTAVQAVDREIGSFLWEQYRKGCFAAEGSKVSFHLDITFECTMNRRASRRAPDVIAQEKASRTIKARQKALDKEKWQKEREKRRLLSRKRITNQIDHAFASGRSGSEPVAKYITCDDCSGPAALLYLSHPVPPGAAVLDETTINGAVCGEHNSTYARNGCDFIPCSRLEFFYDGVRQIAMKESR